MPTFNGFTSKAAALRHLKAAGFNVAGLLADPLSNPKVAKNGKVDVLTAPLHLAPFNLSGFQVCPQASDGCAAACLHTAGNPAYMAQKAISRENKTRAYFKERGAFMAVLAFEIAAHARKADRKGMAAAVRLNATSDLPWERRTINVDGADVLLMDYFAGVQFYDYTKVTKRALAWAEGRMPSNYHLTFSRTEANDIEVDVVLRAGGNVAIVMTPQRYREDVAAGEAWTPTIDGHKLCVGVTDGDAHDYRPADPKGCIVALKAKGDAKRDTSGFVLA